MSRPSPRVAQDYRMWAMVGGRGCDRVGRPERPYTWAPVPRFREPQDPDFARLNSSLGFDRRLWPQDVAQSRAHAKMLAVAGELEEGRFQFEADDEDIHMAIERRLTELVGAPGGRLHTARSRNDQVVTDLA